MLTPHNDSLALSEDSRDIEVSESRKHEDTVSWDELRSEYPSELIRNGVRGKYASRAKRKGGKPCAKREPD